jgi:DNA polymerase III subunit delta
VADEMRPAYLIAGTDSAKIAAARSRLRARAESEGGPASLEVIEGEGKTAPAVDVVVAAVVAMTLTTARRYLLVDGVERWRDAEQKEIEEAIGALPADLTIVLVARGKAPARLAKAVERVGGEVLGYDAPRGRQLPRALVEEARQLGFSLDPGAARMLVDRMGSSPVRLRNELERLALWAGKGGEVSSADLEAMVVDTSEAAVWSLADALLERDRAGAVALAERLLDQGQSVPGLIYALASRLRTAQAALVQLERGVPAKQVEAGLGIHPYAAKQLVARLRGASLEQLREATETLADLEVWCRGGADYGDELAFALALGRATGAVNTA